MRRRYTYTQCGRLATLTVNEEGELALTGARLASPDRDGKYNPPDEAGESHFGFA